MDLRRKLQRCTGNLSLAVVTRELQVFSRLIYRGKSQHRRDKSFQKLVRVSKEMKRYISVALPNQLKEFLKLLPSSAVEKAVRKQAGSMASTLCDCALFTAKMLRFIEDTFCEVEQRLRLSLFIPFNSVMAASLSRIWFCLRYHLLVISETFDILRGHCSEDLKLPASIAGHLGRSYREYLTMATAKDQLKRAVMSPALELKEDVRVSGVVFSDSECVRETEGGDMGVPVDPNEAQLESRQKDFSQRAVFAAAQAGAPAYLQEGEGKRRRSPNMVVFSVRRRKRRLKLYVRSKKLILRMNQTSGTWVARHIRLRRTFPNYRTHGFRLQLRLLHGSSRLRPRGRQRRCEGVRVLQRRFNEEMEDAAAQQDSASFLTPAAHKAADRNPGQRILNEKHVHRNSDDIDEIFSDLMKQ